MNLRNIYWKLFIALVIIMFGPIEDFAQTSFINDTTSAPDSLVRFYNTGIFRVKSGGLVNMNDTIDGKVEFLDNSPNNTAQEAIPNIIYRKLSFIGNKRKFVQIVEGKETRPFVVRDSFYIVDSLWEFYVDDGDVNTRREVVNKSKVTGRMRFIFNGEDTIQTLEANGGRFNRMTVDNPYGVRVVNGGGFIVDKQLELKRGELMNDLDSNFTLSDSAIIIRYTYGSIASPPIFGDSVSVYYRGDEADSILAGAELPKDPAILKNLMVENKAGLFLDTTVTVNDTIYVGSLINTNKYDIDGNLIDDSNLLISTSGKNPIYNPNYTYAEITGNLRHTQLFRTVIDSLIYNNPYTWLKMMDSVDIEGIAEITIRMQPGEFPIYDGGDNKIKRFFVITATDTAGNDVVNVNGMTVGYGWKHDKGDMLSDNYETNEKEIDKVLLERWDGIWTEFDGEQEPQLNADSTWAYSYTTSITKLGYFAMGMPGDGIPLVFKALLYLEGPYYKDGTMTTNLNEKDLIPLTPPDIYPYNLDTNRTAYTVSAIPDSVVDWLLLEFRNGTDTTYRTCFLRLDGAVVELDGYSPVQIGRTKIDTGFYYIAVKHRNHLDIVTLNEVRLARDQVLLDSTYNFSDPDFVAGGWGEALKPIKSGSGYIYAMIAGESNGQAGQYGEIDYQNDILEAWKHRNQLGRIGSGNNYNDYKTFLIYDYDLNGIITTKDLNISWNNRGRISRTK